MIRRALWGAALLAGLLSVSQPAAAAVVFENASLYYFTYAEAGGTGADGTYQNVAQDLTGQAASATLPVAALTAQRTAQASFSKDGALLAKATATGNSSVAFLSAGDVHVSNSGTASATVTAAGGLDTQVFAGSSPMYFYSFFYDFVIDTPTEMSFAYDSSESDFQGQFSLGGTQSVSAFLTGSGTLSQVLAPGSYALAIVDYGSGYNALTGTGESSVAFSRDFAFKLEPTTNAVPELATWLMMIAGIGLVGAVLRRRPAHQWAMPRRI